MEIDAGGVGLPRCAMEATPQRSRTHGTAKRHRASRWFDSCTAHPLFFIKLQKSQNAQKSLTPASRARTIGPAFFCIFTENSGAGLYTSVHFADRLLDALA